MCFVSESTNSLLRELCEINFSISLTLKKMVGLKQIFVARPDFFLSHQWELVC